MGHRKRAGYLRMGRKTYYKRLCIGPEEKEEEEEEEEEGDLKKKTETKWRFFS
jgi:hypothetical protein